MKLQNIQEDVLFKKTFAYDGSWFCKKNSPEGVNDCYLDYGRSTGFGIPPKVNATVLATDYNNWTVFYACRDRILNIKTEYVWITARNKTLNEDQLKEAKNALIKLVPDFDIERLVPVTQGEKCNYDL